MAIPSWKITNLTMGAVEVSFRALPLGVSESVVFSGHSLPDDVKYHKGAKKVSIAALPQVEVIRPRAEVVTSAEETKAEPTEGSSKQNKFKRNPS